MKRSATPSKQTNQPPKFRRLIRAYNERMERIDAQLARFLSKKRIYEGDEVLLGSREYAALYGGLR